MRHSKPRGGRHTPQGEDVGLPRGPSRGFPAMFPSLTMTVPTTRPGLRRCLRIAYAPSKNPKRPLPGPLHDAVVVGLFLFLAIGYRFL